LDIQLDTRLSAGELQFRPNTFGILSYSPQVARAYIPTLAYLGER
jgi:hypothetical protein